VLPLELVNLNRFTVVGVLIYHLTQAESTPILSVTVAVTVTGQVDFGVFGRGVVVITGFTVSAEAINNYKYLHHSS
jgi:hypothetical protein